jgi:hypothetical protein
MKHHHETYIPDVGMSSTAANSHQQVNMKSNNNPLTQTRKCCQTSFVVGTLVTLFEEPFGNKLLSDGKLQ